MEKIAVTVTVALLCLMSAQAGAEDLKPGQWEIKRQMTGDQLPDRLQKEKTQTRCITAQEATDIEDTVRQNWLDNGCDEPQTAWHGDTLKWEAMCRSGDRTLASNGTLTVEDAEHYRSETTTQAADGDITFTEDAAWVGACDS